MYQWIRGSGFVVRVIELEKNINDYIGSFCKIVVGVYVVMYIV